MTESPALEAGYGEAAFGFSPGLALWGYTDRSGPATGTRDALMVRALGLRGTNGKLLVWLVCDLGRPPLWHDTEVIRTRALALGVGEVVFHATHTHHAPAVEQLGEPARERMLDACTEAIDSAVAALRPARLAVARCEAAIGHNRRYRDANGTCRMRWRNAERVPTEPVDPEATLVQVEGLDGIPIVHLVHLACHPVVMDASNLEFSADWPGALVEHVSAATGAPCMMLQGACGDINPYLDKTPLGEGGAETMRAVGREAAEAVLAALPSLTPLTGNGAVDWTTSRIDAGVRWNMDDPATLAALESANGLFYEHYMKDLRDELELAMTVALVDGVLALAGIPGEPYVAFQLDYKRQRPAPVSLLCGYVNDYHAYFPPIAEAAAGGYGGSVAVYAGLGAAEKLHAAALIATHQLCGRLRDTAGPEDFAVYE